MDNKDFTSVFYTDQTPALAFEAIKNMRGWWSEDITGEAEKPGDIFSYRFKDVHRCKMELEEAIPGKKLLWKVLENHFSFTKDASEWVGTRLLFEIAEKDGRTEVRFTHQGLVPQYECYAICQEAWTNYIQNSLHDLIANGKGQPNPREGGFNKELAEKFNVEA
jgi:hypothetical protein